MGGGPAGLATAIALRQRGADVMVADALKPPIDKPCGEGLMPDSRRELDRLGVHLETRYGAEFHGILFAGHHDRANAEFPQGAGLGVRRPVLQQLLLDRAEEMGVRLQWGVPVTVREEEPVTVGGELTRYRWMVGADGNASRVRVWAGLDGGTLRSHRFAFRAHYRVAPWSDFVEIHWGETGQAYVTPVGEREVCVAAISRRPGLRLENMLAEMPFLSEKLAGAERTTAERGALTLTRSLPRVARGNVALVGDASGSADAITGEGLAMGFRQALLLAESLEAGGLERYESGHPGILTLPHRMAGLMLMMDRFPALRDRALQAMAARPELFRALLAVHAGEQPLPGFVLRHGATMGALMLAPHRA